MLALVFAIGRLVVRAVDDDAEVAAADTAVVTAAKSTPTAAPSTAAPPVGPTAAPTPTATGTPVVLAEPTGPCAVDEITVTPVVANHYAGRRVQLAMELTGIRPACTFAVSPRTIAVRLTSGQDRIWSSQHCPASITPQTVVVRSSTPTKIVVLWSGRRSDTECSRAAAWALPGYYQAVAAAIGSEPTAARFQLLRPPRPVVTKTIRPKPKKAATPAAG